MAPARSNLWNYVTTVTEATKHSGLKVVKCVFCLAEYKTNTATRISEHLTGCKFVEGDIPLAKGHNGKDKGKSVAPYTVAVSTAVASTSARNIEIIRKHGKITDWASKVSENEKNRSDREFALAFFSGGVPFRFIENPYLLRAMGILRPGYKLPTRRQLSNKMLDDCYASLQLEMNADISKATYVSLATDAWTNVNGESVINFILLLPRPVFYEAVYTADCRHTGDYLAKITGDVIRKIGVEKVVAVVMDNAAANKASAKLLEQEFRDTSLTCFGCGAHWLNLLAKEINEIEEYQTMLSQAVQVIKTFSNKHVVAAKLADLQQATYSRTIALQMPVETRWMSHCNALKSIIDSKTALQQFCIIPELSCMLSGHKEAEVKRNVLSDDFWVKATELRAHLEPLSGAILQLEKDTGMLTCVYAQFQSLSNYYKASSLPNADRVLDLFESRWSKFYTPVVAIAHLVNPANVGCHQDRLMMEKAEAYIRQSFDGTAAASIISSLWCYVSKSGGFTDEMFTIFAAGTPSDVWWSQCRCGSQHDALRSLALKLLHMPATSAASERNWSAFRFIHTRLRNRLRSCRVQKLVYVFENTKPVPEKDLDEGLDALVSCIED